MFRPIHGHHQVDLTLKILLCKRAMMWRSQHQSLLCSVYKLYRWKEAVTDQNYMLLWWYRGLLQNLHIIARLHSRILRVTINLMMTMNWQKHVFAY